MNDLLPGAAHGSQRDPSGRASRTAWLLQLTQVCSPSPGGSSPTAYLSVEVLEDVLQDVCFNPGQHQLLGCVHSYVSIAQDQSALYFLHFVVTTVLLQQMRKLTGGTGGEAKAGSSQVSRGRGLPDQLKVPPRRQRPLRAGFGPLLPNLLAVAETSRALMEHQASEHELH